MVLQLISLDDGFNSYGGFGLLLQVVDLYQVNDECALLLLSDWWWGK